MPRRQPTSGLVQKAQQGDRQALDDLFEGQRSVLRYIIRSRLGASLKRDADVDDIYQETALRAFQSIGNFQYRDEDSFFRWVTTIAMHVLKDLARRRSRRPEGSAVEPLASDIDSPSKGPRREERLSRLKNALETLSAEHREVVTLAWLEGQKIEAIAGRMNRSPDAIRKLLLRALRKLRDSFGDTESLRLPVRGLLEEKGSENGKRASTSR